MGRTLLAQVRVFPCRYGRFRHAEPPALVGKGECSVCLLQERPKMLILGSGVFDEWAAIPAYDNG